MHCTFSYHILALSRLDVSICLSLLTGSHTNVGRKPTGIYRPARHIKLRDITDVDDSQYYHFEGEYDVYHIDQFVIEGIAYGDKRFGNGYHGTIVCMVKRRSDDLDKASIFVGLKLVRVM